MENKDVLSGNIEKFLITNFKTKASIDISAGISDLRYYENILSNTISLSVVFTDTGYKQDSNDKESISVLDGLPLRGGEEVDIIIEDAKDNPTRLKLKVYVNRVRNVNTGTNTESYIIDFCSAETFANEQSRVVERYSGKISENVKTILTDKLKTNKNIILDDTLIDYEFIGNDRKPLHVCTWLASRSVPSGYGKKNASAGYFLYETSDAFNFRSIDGLMSQNPKKQYVYSETAEKKDGFEKVLSYGIDRNIDLQEQLILGSYANRSIFFDFYAMDYEIRNYSVDEDQNGKVVNLGKDENNHVSDQFRQPISRLMSHVLDVGTLPPGKTPVSQLKNWKTSPLNPTYDVKTIMVQSIMRYNQMFGIKINIVVAGDFGLKAGDVVYFEFPQVKSGDPDVDVLSSGKYVISSLCHRITSVDTFTSMTLVRDTFRKQK